MAFAKRQKNIRQNISCSVLLTQHTLSIDKLRFGVLLIFVLLTQTLDASLIFCSSSIQCKEENAESHDEKATTSLEQPQNSNHSDKVSDTQATETNNSSQINDNEEEDSNSDEAEDLDEKPDPYSFSDEDENANNSTLGDDGEESIKAEEIDPAGVR